MRRQQGRKPCSPDRVGGGRNAYYVEGMKTKYETVPLLQRCRFRVTERKRSTKRFPCPSSKATTQKRRHRQPARGLRAGCALTWVDAGSGRDHDNVSMGRRWDQPILQERPLQLHRGVVQVLGKAKPIFPSVVRSAGLRGDTVHMKRLRVPSARQPNRANSRCDTPVQSRAECIVKDRRWRRGETARPGGRVVSGVRGTRRGSVCRPQKTRDMF